MTATRFAAFFVVLLSVSPPSLSHAEGRDPVNVRQSVSASRMRTLQTCLSIYRDEHGHSAPNLALAVSDLYPSPIEDYLHDAWGRAFAYYYAGDTDVIISLGKDGLPDAAARADEGENTDLVMVGGNWAKLPAHIASF